MLKLVKGFYKAGKLIRKAMIKQDEIMDTMIEREYITSAVDALKATAGETIIKVGQGYQKTINQLEKIKP